MFYGINRAHHILHMFFLLSSGFQGNVHDKYLGTSDVLFGDLILKKKLVDPYLINI